MLASWQIIFQWMMPNKKHQSTAFCSIDINVHKIEHSETYLIRSDGGYDQHKGCKHSTIIRLLTNFCTQKNDYLWYSITFIILRKEIHALNFPYVYIFFSYQIKFTQNVIYGSLCSKLETSAYNNQPNFEYWW